jgi:small subunit ribosomal protein S6
VIDSLLKAEETDNTIEKIERTIKNNGGKIEATDRWGKKRLAYEIKKRQYGYYVEIIFKSVGDIIKIIEREYGLDENILRYLTLKMDKKSLEYYDSRKQNFKKEVDRRSENESTNEENVPNEALAKNQAIEIEEKNDTEEEEVVSNN